MKDAPQVDALVLNEGSGLGFGSVAQRLMSNGMNINALRTNDVLRKEEWLLFDRTVVEIARARLLLVSDLVTRGLTVPIPNAMGTTVIQHETSSDMTAASLTMSGLADAERDRLEFQQVNTPLPIAHKDFQVSVRNLESSRRLGMPLDTSMAAVATRKVVDLLEDIVMNGATITSGGGSLYGYRTHPNINTGTITATWSTATGAQVMTDVLAMIAALQADFFFGPYVIYVDYAAYNNLLNDFKTNSDKTILQRVLEIPDIQAVRPSSNAVTAEVLMVQMSSDVVDLLEGMQPTTVMWETHGGMMINFKVMAIMTPRLKADQEGRSGIILLS
ncbi:MAG: DUF2184 domain-containing protein [Lysobacterales bacterium]|nr:MAG: DUF2184 domain-containing protein [Xanthomonadales bacterium]